MATKYFWGDEPDEAEYYASQGVSNSQSYFTTPSGQRLFTQSFRPLGAGADDDPKALVFMTHGYGSDTGWLFQKIAIAFASWGYSVHVADLLGHGRSDGLRGYLGDPRRRRRRLPLLLPLRPRLRPRRAPDPGLPLRRVPRRAGDDPHLPPVPAGALDGAHPLRAPLRDPGGHEALPRPPLPLRPPLRRRRHVAGDAGEQHGREGHTRPREAEGDRVEPAAVHGEAEGGDHEGDREDVRARAGGVPEGVGAVPGGARDGGRGDGAGGVEDAVREGGERGQGDHPLRGDAALAGAGGAGGEQPEGAGGHEEVDRRKDR
ncbi:putative caffeoylshikimate esterase [Iris pallida]|uniref:Caffeoylshikimate esterase n=1 Tax=Iris pallida TaxID=29817 RepID=A0AAX6ED31_IRIPA|nr:putative caffeoylshikimate esterase [Iris pallida]